MYDLSDSKIYRNSGNPEVLKLAANTGTNILDVGCGGGGNAAVLKGAGKVVDGITISASELEEAKKYLRDGYIYNLENGLPPEIPDNTYDAVICSHVLEHIGFPQALLGDIRRVLKPGGKLIVALPNVFYYKYRFVLMMGEMKTTDTGIWDYTHLRWYSLKSARYLLQTSGFEVLIADVSGEMPFSGVFRFLLPSAVRQFIYRMLTAISKGFFGYQLLLVGENKK